MQGQPVLIDFSSSVLDRQLFFEGGGAPPIRRARRLGQLLARLSGVNKSATRFAGELLRRLPPDGRVLVVGGATVGSGAQALYDAGVVVGLDIYPSQHTALVADAHAIPFADETFDAVWIQAVLEHVLSPEQVVQEIHRVLKPDGYVFADTPFLQHVHEGAYDFTRFTMNGHRWLFRNFRLLDAGSTGGAGTTLTWALKYFARALTGSNKIGSAVGLAFSWLRLFDGTSQGHEDAACGTYFFGRKSTESLSREDLVSFYASRREPAPRPRGVGKGGQ
ncbi:MAG: class SAM-dependent methyltransferase [Caulobacteraceae bacterium]|nr:class SAM-dependent methyltransferase [Caulobacteraceae bacterium]